MLIAQEFVQLLRHQCGLPAAIVEVAQLADVSLIAALSSAPSSVHHGEDSSPSSGRSSTAHADPKQQTVAAFDKRMVAEKLEQDTRCANSDQQTVAAADLRSAAEIVQLQEEMCAVSLEGVDIACGREQSVQLEQEDSHCSLQDMQQQARCRTSEAILEQRKHRFLLERYSNVSHSSCS